MASFDLLFVIADADSITFPDQQMQDFLELWDWIVTLISDEDPDIDSDTFLEGFVVVVYSESCSSTTLGSSGDTADVGIVTLEPGQYDDLRLTGGHTASEVRADFKPITLHESLGGLAGSGDNNETTFASEDKDIRYTDNAAVGGAGGVKIGVTQTTRTIMAAWETGDDLDSGSPAVNRRLLNSLFRISQSAPDETVSPGFVNNDLSWVILAAQIEWAAGHNPLTDRQVAFPVTEVHRDAAWSANAPTDIDDVTPVTSSVYTVDGIGVIVFRLGSLTDPGTPALHHLVIGLRRSATGGNIGGTMTFNRNWVSEASPGTEVASTTLGGFDAQTEWAGDVIALTEAQADAIVGSEYDNNLYGINSVIGLIAAFGVIYYLAQMDLVGAGVAFIIMRITYSIAKTDEDFIEYWY